METEGTFWTAGGGRRAEMRECSFYDRVGRGEEAMLEGDCAAVGGRWVYLTMMCATGDLFL